MLPIVVLQGVELCALICSAHAGYISRSGGWGNVGGVLVECPEASEEGESAYDDHHPACNCFMLHRDAERMDC